MIKPSKMINILENALKRVRKRLEATEKVRKAF